MTKDIVVFGPLATWEITQRGQRIAQMIDVWLKQGHRVLYVATDKDKNPEKFESDNFKIHHYPVCLNGNVDNFSRMRNLSFQLEYFEKEENDKVCIIEMPLEDYKHIPKYMASRGYKIIYELIDKWEEMPPYKILRQPNVEKQIVDNSHIIVGSSKALVKELIDSYKRPDTFYLPNACNRDKFNLSMASSTMPKDMFISLCKSGYNPETHTIVYYQGAIGANWFWWELVRDLAKSLPNFHFVFVGWWWEQDNFSTKDWANLRKLKNVHYLGMKTHDDCVSYCAYSDICIIPFRDIPMIHATSPNKIFEYISLYKPVIDLGQETAGYPLVYHSSTLKEWKETLKMLSQEIHSGFFQKQINKKAIDSWLDTNTWEDRANKLLSFETCHMEGMSNYISRDYVVWEYSNKPIRVKQKKSIPKVSIIMLNMNGSKYTIPSIMSLIQNTTYENYEVIVVDNNSRDGFEKEYLQNLKKKGFIDKIVWNKKNLGFSGGNNSGGKVATGKYHCYVNNDLIFHKGWLTNMMKNMSKDVGLIGPVSNNVGSGNNPQRIYYKNQKQGMVYEAERLSGFCLLINTSKLGKQPWDEEFSQVDKGVFGCFEDDDISIRSRDMGLKNLVVGDSYVFHKMMATFTHNKINNSFSYEFNKKLFEKKYPKEKAHWWKGKYDISNEVK